MHWNYRLYKEKIKDELGREFEKLSLKEVYYDKEVNPTGFCSFSLEEFSELDMGPDEHIDKLTQDDLNKMTYLPIEDEESIKSLRGTLTKMLEALEKPILSKTDFKGNLKDA